MIDNSTHISDSLLTKFLLGEASVQEQQQVQAWLDASDQNCAYLDQMEQIWLEAGKLTPKPIDVDVDAAWNKVEPQLQGRTISLRRTYFAIAASIALIAGLFAVYNTIFSTSQPQLFANTSLQAIVDSLPDGSTIQLAQNSEIEYSYNKKTNTRHAKLKGEAFFNVHRDTTQQFIVDVGFGGVKVLGTSFNVKPDSSSTDVTVDVLSGTVMLFYLREQGDTLYLTITKGQSGVISLGLDTLLLKPQANDAFFHINKMLSFSAVPLRNVFNTIEECYGIKVIYANDSIAKLPLTSSFKNEDIEVIMEVIANTFGLEYTNNKTEYLFDYKPDNSTDLE